MSIVLSMVGRSALDPETKRAAENRKKLEAAGRAAPDTVRSEVRVIDSGARRALAYVERDPSLDGADSKGKVPPRLLLWEDEHRQRPMAYVATRPGMPKGRAAYLVHSADGGYLAGMSVVNAAVWPPRRTSWTIEQAGRPVVAGKKGRVVWWFVWWLTLPILALFMVMSLFSNGDGFAARTPRRLILRADGRTVLDFHAIRESYVLPSPWLDPRVAAAFVAVHSKLDQF